MKARTLSLAGLMTLTTAAMAVGQDAWNLSSGLVDVQQLRRQVLSEVLADEALELPADLELAELEQQWGMTFGEIPKLLYLHCPVLQDSRGLLIRRLRAGGPADLAGLRPGQILLQVDDDVLYTQEDLCDLDKPHKVQYLDKGELVSTTVKPGRQRRRALPDDLATVEATAGRASSFARSYGPSVRSSYSTSTSSAVSAGQEAISIAGVNGRFKVEAISPDRKTIRLEGSRREIERQLENVPAPLGRAIGKQLRLVD